jgi:hypothetical protein
MRLRTEAGLYALTVAMWLPALLSVFFGNQVCYTIQQCAQNFWDFYQSTFMVLDLLAFVPLSMVIVNFSKRASESVAFLFTLSGLWCLVLAIPDWLRGDLSPEYQELWFATASAVVLLFNVILYLRPLTKRPAH